jgi:hypothetical protein
MICYFQVAAHVSTCWDKLLILMSQVVEAFAAACAAIRTL